MKTRRQFLAGSVATALWAGAGSALGAGSSSRSEEKKSVRRVLWAANVRSKPFRERLDAAAEHGFTHLSMFPIDFQGLLDAGQTEAAIRSTVEASGVRILVCDPFTQWVPRWTLPEGYPESYVSFVTFDEDFLFRMAETVGAEAVNCVEPFGVRYETAELVDSLGAFAERAGSHGLRICHEFMPISGIPDLRSGWDVVKLLDAERVGLTFDTWHFFRSDPDFDLLESIPGDRIFEVQLADAATEIQGGDITTDLLSYRRLPGEGDFDLERTWNILKRNGAIRSVGPEVFADAMDALSTDEAARRAAAALSSWLD